MELKRIPAIHTVYEHKSFNRTNMELKHDRIALTDYNGSAAFNRTNMELKHGNNIRSV